VREYMCVYGHSTTTLLYEYMHVCMGACVCMGAYMFLSLSLFVSVLCVRAQYHHLCVCERVRICVCGYVREREDERECVRVQVHKCMMCGFE